MVTALALVGAGALLTANQVRLGVQERALANAELTASAVVLLTVDRNVTYDTGLRPGTQVSEPSRLDMAADIKHLNAGKVLLGLEIWRRNGTLAFADAGHPVDEKRLPEEERLKALKGDFMQAGDETDRGVPTMEVFRSFDPNDDGVPDAFVEVVLPAIGQADMEQTTWRMYAALAILAAVIGLGLVTFNRRLAERARAAMRDPLTGLGNRLALRMREEPVQRAQEPTTALVLLDLDGFKAVNDTLGHQAGDQLLIQVARTLESLVRSADLVVRLGGDEFAVLLQGPQTRERALRTAQSIIAGLAQHGFTVDGVQLDVEASAGVAVRPDDADDVAGLLQRADIAMYQAKQRGSGAVLYDPDQDPHDVPKLQLLAQLRHAIDNDELVLHYQPKADLGTGGVRSVEALVRWEHPSRGLLQPDDFIPMAEHTALIQPLTAWVLEQACSQTVSWHAAGMPLSVAVNISPRSLLTEGMPEMVLETLARTGLPAAFLELEITETAMVADARGAQAVLQKLRTMGVRVSLDDFGTGYTSMALLQTLPVTALKIDRAFVTGMLASDDDAAVAESLIALAQRLGLKVVAEGVETEVVWERLRELGCDQAQGFHLARPMPAALLPDWIADRAGDSADGTGAASEAFVSPDELADVSVLR